MFWRSLVSSQTTCDRALVWRQRGFGLIELMVSISIMVIVASIILARHDAFNSAVLLRSQAYEIALEIREVQLSAVSASGDTGDFRSTNGLWFSSDPNPVASPANGRYQVFIDSTSGADDNNFYDSGEESGPISRLDNRFMIRALRAPGDAISGDEVSVIFERPNFDARFFDGASSELTNASSIEIDIARRGTAGAVCGSEFRTIEVTRTGQIAVKDCP